jgi:predicted nucleic acid-binding protein
LLLPHVIWLTKLLAAGEMVTVTERIAACRDPTDDKFLELAVNGRGDLIVSGDGDRLVLNPSGVSRSSRQPLSYRWRHVEPVIRVYAERTRSEQARRHQ